MEVLERERTRSTAVRQGVLLASADTPRRIRRKRTCERTIGRMKTLIICERCDGTGADPDQDSIEVRVCVECGGDGCHITYFGELRQTA
jgi:DnaJ-class molecular chaperone